MLEWVSITCPYCGEAFDSALDYSAGAQQQYVEDCQICCHPVLLRISLSGDGKLQTIEIHRENE